MHGPMNVKFFVYLITATNLCKSSLNLYPYNIKIVLIFVIVYKPGLNRIET